MKWCKTRHKVVQKILRPILLPFLKIKYGLNVKAKEGYKDGAIILSNHVTVFDMFYVASYYKTPLYFMASMDIFEHAFIGKLIKWFVNPIPKEKGKKSDINCIKICTQVASEKGSICIFPEGNRTMDGRLTYIDPSIVQLIKILKKPLVLFNIKNGYGVDPRWANKSRKGKIELEEKRVLKYSQYKDMTDEELYSFIKKELTVDDYDTNQLYNSKSSAEYLERVFYICPVCNSMHTLYSKKDKLICHKCGLEVKYNEDLTFTPNNDKFQFKNLKEYYDYQIEVIKNKEFDDSIIYQDKIGAYIPRLYKSKQKLGNGQIILYKDRFEVITKKINIKLFFDDIDSVTMLGRKKINIITKNQTYQLFGDKKMNLLKYIQAFYIIKSKKGGIDNEFFGL